METNIASQHLADAKQNAVSDVIKKKKISFISAILLIISSCIGSGIFFKAGIVLNYNWGSFSLSIVSWVISAIAVICMSIALIEVASKGNDNLSLIGWCKKFNNKFVYKCCKNFMFYVYTPLEYFYLPYYAIICIQGMLNGFGISSNFNTANDWAIWMVIGMLISTYFIFTSGISTKVADIQNKVILMIKFIPLAAVVIIGLVIIANNGVNIQIAPQLDVENVDKFYQIWPGIGTILSLSAIFFAFDGFYFAAGIQKEMKEPKKTPKAILIGLLIVTVIYLVIAIVMSLASKTGEFNGSNGGYEAFLKEHNLSALFAIINLLIAFSVLGTLNGFTTWATRLAENLIKDNEIPFAKKLVDKIDPHNAKVGAIYVYVVSMSVVLLFSMIGGLSYLPDGYLLDGNSTVDGIGFNSTARLFTFSDLMSNWTAIFAFSFIIIALGGCYRNRKTKKVDVIENKYFKPTAIIAMIIVGLSMLLTTIQPFVELGLIHQDTSTSDIISKVMLLVTLFVFLGFTIIPTFFDKEFLLELKQKKGKKI